jgi:malonate-semialdehyde dehydrogenase (acetylating)/methylmalonate-semialdehyde dehydrogenase
LNDSDVPDVLSNYVGGAFTPSEGALLDVTNPSRGDVIAHVPMSTPAEVDVAVRAASVAYETWRFTPVGTRVTHLYRLLDAIRREEEVLARLIVLEMGKSLPDARAEMKRLIQNLEVACAMPMLQQGSKLVGASADMDGEVLPMPLGVFAMFAPFNFPGMVPFWFLPYALATGNTFVMKPSEQVPCTMQAIARLIDEAGMPPGVFNLVNGDKVVSRALMEHPRVVGVSMVGSTPVARITAETCARHGKRFQALGGAKNHLVIMPDAPMDEVVRNLVTSCFGCAGQRCMAASAIVCVGERTHRELVDAFTAAARAVIVADPLDPAVENESMVCGPVISPAARERIHGLIEKGIAEGARALVDGRGVHVAGREGGNYVGPTILGDVAEGATVHRTEIFGPVAVILKADSFDEALAIVNGHEYANGASLYTRSGYYARRFKLEAEAGMIGINVGIPAPVAYMPFGGAKSSFFADVKAQGRSVVNFFTQERVVTERWWKEDE